MIIGPSNKIWMILGPSNRKWMILPPAPTAPHHERV